MKALEPEKKSAFDKNGYVSIHEAVQGEELENLRNFCLELMARRGIIIGSNEIQSDSDDEPLVWIRCKNEERDEFSNVSTIFEQCRRWASELLDVEESRLNPKLRIFYKKPHSRSEVEWHQDEAFYQTFSGVRPQGYRSVNCWLALDDADASNGCLKYIPGSNSEPLVSHDIVSAPVYEGILEGESREDDKQSGITLRTKHVDESRAECVELKRGGLNIHHCRTLHGSDDNTSDNPRGAFVMIFQEKKSS